MNLFIPIILIIISGGVFFTYIDGEYKDIIELKKTRNSFLDQELKVSKIREEKAELIEKYNKIDSEGLEGLIKLLPSHVDNVELLVDIQRIIKENGIGISISDISLVGTSNIKKKQAGKIDFESSKNYNSIDVSFSFVTKYDIFKRFMGNINESLRVLDVSAISLRSESNRFGKKSDNFKFDVTLRTY
jgi:Tfp pilus assembly protein PilO